MYKINFGVWENGSGWQPHDITDKTADTYEDAVDIAIEMSVIYSEQVIATIRDTKGKIVKEIGWE